MTAPLSLAVAVAVVALAAFAFRHSPLCHEPRDHVVAWGDAVFADDGETAFLAVFSQRSRPAAEFCTVLGSGEPISVRGALAVYQVKIGTGAFTPLLVADSPVPFEGQEGIEFRRRSGNRYFGAYHGRPRGADNKSEREVFYFEVDTEAGIASTLPGEAYEAASAGAEEIDPSLFPTGTGFAGPAPGRTRGGEYTTRTMTVGVASETTMSFTLKEGPPHLDGPRWTFAVVNEWPRKGLPCADDLDGSKTSKST